MRVRSRVRELSLGEVLPSGCVPSMSCIMNQSAGRSSREKSEKNISGTGMSVRSRSTPYQYTSARIMFFS